MKKLIIATLIFPLSLACASTKNNTKNELKPFTTDGCSIVPDFSFTDCCIIHDVAYWIGGTRFERQQSDYALKQCVTNNSNSFVGSIYYWGVRIGGRPNMLTSYRWGYGWKFNMGYRPLTESELNEVARLMPTNPLEVPVTDPNKNLKKRPVKHGSYCMDEIFEYIDNAYLVKQNIEVDYVDKHTDQLHTNVRVRMSDGEVFRFKYWNRKWKECQKPQFGEVLPKFYDQVFQY
jgi:hypothetical protein